MGGAERSLVNIVNHLHAVHPTVVLIETAADLLEELNSGQEVFSLDNETPTSLSAIERQHAEAAASTPRRGRPRGETALEMPGLLTKAFRLARVARATGATVVSTFLNRSHTIALLAKLVFAPRLAIVINVHEMLSDHLDRHFAPFERRFMRAFIRYGFPRAARIVAVAEGVKEDLVRHFAIPADRIVVLPNPIDLSRIRRASAERVDDLVLHQGSRLIVAVGRLVRLKGFDVLIRALAALPTSIPARLAIIGEGDDRRALEQLATSLGVADRTTLLGSRANPWKYMARADVVVLPSRTEAFPNVIGEALALSRPVVATRASPGVAAYLEDGRYGMLVPPDDPAALSQAIARMLTDHDLRAQLSAEGASRAEAFALDRVVARYEAIVTEVARA